MTWTPTRLVGYNAALSTTVAGVVTKVAGLQSADIDVSAQMVKSTTVDDGGWASNLPGIAEWTASGKFALIAGDTTQENLLSALIGKTLLTVTFTPTNAGVGSGAPTYSGSCYVRSLKIATGGVNAEESLDVQLDGQGPLTVGAL